MFGPKLDSKSYTTFLLIVIGVLLSLNLFAQFETPTRTVEDRFDTTSVQRQIADSNQAVASATLQVAAANQAIAEALQAVASSIDAKREFDVNVTLTDDGSVPAPARPVAAADDLQPAPTPEPQGTFRITPN